MPIFVCNQNNPDHTKPEGIVLDLDGTGTCCLIITNSGDKGVSLNSINPPKRSLGNDHPLFLS
jgi:hypothetical protein